MFSNFIYFIVALLLYSIYQPPGELQLSLLEALATLLLASLLFFVLCRHAFARAARMIAGLYSAGHPGYRFGNTLLRMSISALLLFAFVVYGLHLPAFAAKLWLFATFPTLAAVLFFTLFAAAMAVVWYHAWPLYRLLSDPEVTRRDYIVSNLSFALPVILPWVLLSLIIDLVAISPFAAIRNLLATPEGEIGFFLLFLLTVAVLAPALIQRIWRCRPLETGSHRSRIEALCRRAGLRYRDIVTWPIFGGRMLTAGVMGLVRRFRYILVTRSLLERLQPEEIDAVVAHEIGHVKQHHLIYYLLFFVAFMFVAASLVELVFAWMISTPFVFGLLIKTGSYQTTVAAAINGLLLTLVFVLYFRFIFGYFMRNFERQADIYVYSLFPSAAPLISTFNKISLTSGEPPDKPNWHHFSIRERVEYLQHCEQDPAWIGRHHRKVKKSVALFLAILLITAGASFHLGRGEWGRNIRNGYYESMLRLNADVIIPHLEAAIRQRPHSAELYFQLAELNRIKGDTAASISAYEAAVTLAPADAEFRNNLAWTYATCEDLSQRNPQRALQLALTAVDLSPQPHILDTLAESYFVNGQYRDALETGRRALSSATGDRSHFEKQMEKFERAAAGEVQE